MSKDNELESLEQAIESLRTNEQADALFTPTSKRPAAAPSNPDGNVKSGDAPPPPKANGGVDLSSLSDRPAPPKGKGSAMRGFMDKMAKSAQAIPLDAKAKGIKPSNGGGKGKDGPEAEGGEKKKLSAKQKLLLLAVIIFTGLGFYARMDAPAPSTPKAEPDLSAQLPNSGLDLGLDDFEPPLAERNSPEGVSDFTLEAPQSPDLSAALADSAPPGAALDSPFENASGAATPDLFDLGAAPTPSNEAPPPLDVFSTVPGSIQTVPASGPTSGLGLIEPPVNTGEVVKLRSEIGTLQQRLGEKDKALESVEKRAIELTKQVKTLQSSVANLRAENARLKQRLDTTPSTNAPARPTQAARKPTPTPAVEPKPAICVKAVASAARYCTTCVAHAFVTIDGKDAMLGEGDQFRDFRIAITGDRLNLVTGSGEIAHSFWSAPGGCEPSR